MELRVDILVEGAKLVACEMLGREFKSELQRQSLVPVGQWLVECLCGGDLHSPIIGKFSTQAWSGTAEYVQEFLEAAGSK